jgi:uncharacterized protein YrrD
MENLGAPVAHTGLTEGVPVYDQAGRRIGVLDDVMTDGATGIFKGVLIHTMPLPGRHLYATEDQIAELRERGVLLSVVGEALQPPPERRRRHDVAGRAPESPIESALRRLWDRMTGVR